MVNPQEAGDKQKPTNSDKLQALIMQEWAAISQDVAQKLIDSMSRLITVVLKKKSQHCKYWLFASTEMLVIKLQYSIVTSDKNM